MGTINLHASRAAQAAKLRAQQARILRDAALAAPLPERTVYVDPSDERQLRGIPAVGRGVSGHVAGTHPERDSIDRIMRGSQNGDTGRHGDHGNVQRWIT